MIRLILGIVLSTVSVWGFINPRKETLTWFLIYFIVLFAGLSLIITSFLKGE